MNLINICLIDDPFSICIEADGHVWDLHNAFDFEGFGQHVSERSVRLFWRSNQYAIPPQPVHTLEIMFADVDYFEVTPRDAEIPDLGEDLCLDIVSRISPEDDTQEIIASGVPYRLDFGDNRFHLLFQFRGGQHIRIGAKTVTLKALAASFGAAPPI